MHISTYQYNTWAAQRSNFMCISIVPTSAEVKYHFYPRIWRYYIPHRPNSVAEKRHPILFHSLLYFSGQRVAILPSLRLAFTASNLQYWHNHWKGGRWIYIYPELARGDERSKSTTGESKLGGLTMMLPYRIITLTVEVTGVQAQIAMELKAWDHPVSYSFSRSVLYSCPWFSAFCYFERSVVDRRPVESRRVPPKAPIPRAARDLDHDRDLPDRDHVRGATQRQWLRMISWTTTKAKDRNDRVVHEVEPVGRRVNPRHPPARKRLFWSRKRISEALLCLYRTIM